MKTYINKHHKKLSEAYNPYIGGYVISFDEVTEQQALEKLNEYKSAIRLTLCKFSSVNKDLYFFFNIHEVTGSGAVTGWFGIGKADNLNEDEHYQVALRGDLKVITREKILEMIPNVWEVK